MSARQLTGLEAEVASALVDLSMQSSPAADHWLRARTGSTSEDSSVTSTPEFAEDRIDLTGEEPQGLMSETSEDESGAETKNVVSHLSISRNIRTSKKLTKTPTGASTPSSRPYQRTTTQNRAHPRLWSELEKSATRTLMREVVSEFPTNYTEWRFKEVSQRLEKRFGVNRSCYQVKNFWNREGRLISGLDERKKPRPECMATGIQDPARRRELRRLKKPEKTLSARAANAKSQIRRSDARSKAANNLLTGSMQHRKLPGVVVDEDLSHNIRKAQGAEQGASSMSPIATGGDSTPQGPTMGVFKLPKNAGTIEDILTTSTYNVVTSSSTSTGVFSQASFNAFKRMWYQYSANKTGTRITPTDASELLLVDFVNAYTPVEVLNSMHFGVGDLASKQYAISTALFNFHKKYVSVLGDVEDGEELEQAFEDVIEAVTNAGMLVFPAEVEIR